MTTIQQHYMRSVLKMGAANTNKEPTEFVIVIDCMRHVMSSLSCSMY